MAYSDKVIDHYENPRNVGAFEKGDASIGTGMVGAPAGGDVMKLQIKVGADGRIEDARFKTYGCGSAIASSSLVTEWVKGKTLDEAATIKNTQIAEELSLPPVKIHCSILAEDAIKAAVADYKKKHSVEEKKSPDGRDAHRESGEPRPELPRQARQGRGLARGGAHLGLLGHGLQARVRRPAPSRRPGIREPRRKGAGRPEEPAVHRRYGARLRARGAQRGLQVPQPEGEG